MVKVLDPARVDATEQVASVPESNIDALRRENAPQDPVTVDPLSIITDSDSSHMQSHAALHQRQQRDRVVSTSAGRDVTRELAEQEAGLHSSSDRDVEEERIRSLVRSAVRPAQRTLSPDSLAQLENNIATKVSGANVNPAQLQAAMDAMSTRLEGDLVANLRMGDRSESEIVEELSELIIEALEEEGLVLEEARDEYTEEEVTPEQRISPAMQIQLERKAIVDAKVIAVTQALEAQEPLVAVGDVMRQLPADMHQEFLDAFREAQGQTLLSALDADPETERGIAAAQLVETGRVSDQQLYKALEERAIDYAERLGRTLADREKSQRDADVLKQEWADYAATYDSLFDRIPGLEQQLDRTINYHSDKVRAETIAETVYDMAEFARKEWGKEKERNQAHEWALQELEKYKQRNQDFFDRNPEIKEEILQHEQAAVERVEDMLRKCSQRAEALKREFRGWTDSEAVYDLLKGLTREEIIHVTGYYNAMGRGDLERHVRSNVTNGTWSYTGYEDRCVDLLHYRGVAASPATPVPILDRFFEGRDPSAQVENLFSSVASDQVFGQVQLALHSETAAFDLHAVVRELSAAEREDLDRRLVEAEGKDLEALIAEHVSTASIDVPDPETHENVATASEREIAEMLISGEEIDDARFFSYVNYVHTNYALERAALMADRNPSAQAEAVQSLDRRFHQFNQRLVTQFGVQPEYLDYAESNVKRIEEQERFRLVQLEVTAFSQEVGIERAQGSSYSSDHSRHQSDRSRYLESQSDFVAQPSEDVLAAVQSGQIALSQLPVEQARYLQLTHVMRQQEQAGTDMYLRAESAIKDIEAAMYGGLERIGIPLGTNEDKIYANLEGRSEREMSIMQSLYRDRFQRSMRGDFIDEMSGAHLDRGIALLERRKADAVAAEAYLALTAFWGPNEEKLRTAVDKLDTEDDRAQFNTTFNDNYLEDLENIAESRDTQASEHDYYRPDYEFNNFEDVVTNFLGKESAAIVMADMNDDDTALAVALVAENLTRMNISEEELARTVEKEVIDPETGAVDPERLTEFRARFEELQGRSFDEAVDEVYADYADNQYTAITWLQRMTSVNEEGKPTYTREEIAAAKVWWAIKGYGADTDTVKQAVVPPDAAAFSEEEQAQLQAIADPGLRQQRADEIRREKQDAYRAGLDAAYQELSGGETLEECVRYQFSDSYERTILHLMENGELEEIYEMREAMGTYMDGCDVDAVKRILSNKTKTEIDQFIEDFNKEFPDIDFLERLKVEVNGSDMSRRASSGALWSIVNPLAGMKAATSTPTDSQDWFDVQVLLEGDFSDVQPGTEQAVQALQAFSRQIQERRDYDRSGWAWGQNLVTVGMGTELDDESREASEYIEQALADGVVTAEELAQARALVDRTQSISDSFRQQRDEMAQQIADGGTMVVLTTTCIVVTVGTGGGAAPVAVMIIAGTAASGGIRYGTKAIICGNSYTTDNYAIGSDGVLAVIDGATMGFGVGMGGKVTTEVAKRVGQQALRQGVKVYCKGVLVESAEEVGHILLERSLLMRVGTNAFTGAVDGGSSAFLVSGATTGMDKDTWKDGVLPGLGHMFSDGMSALPQGLGMGVGLGGLFSLRQPKTVRMSAALSEADVTSWVSRGRISQADVDSIVARDGYVTRGAALEAEMNGRSVSTRRANRWIRSAERNGVITPEEAGSLRTRVQEGGISELELRDSIGTNPYEYYTFQQDPNGGNGGNGSAGDTAVPIGPPGDDSGNTGSPGRPNETDGPEAAPRSEEPVEPTVLDESPEVEFDIAAETVDTTMQVELETPAAEASLRSDTSAEIPEQLPTQEEILHTLSTDSEVMVEPTGIPETPAPGSFRETQARRRGQMYEDQLNNGSRTAPQVQPELAPELRTSEARVLYADEVAGDNINLDDILERTQQRMSQTGADDLPEVDLDDVLRRTEQNMRGETPDAGPTLDDMIAETERRMNLSSSDELPEVDLEQVFARTQQDGPSHAPDEAPEFNLDDVFAETERRMREAADARGSDLDVQSQRSTQQLELEPGDYDFGLPRDLMTAPDDLVQRMYADAEVPTDAKIDIGAAINQRGEVRFDELQDILKRNGASEETLARYQVTEELVDSARERGIRYDSEPEASEATTSQSNDPGSQSSGGTQDGSGTGHGSGGRAGAREDAGHSSGPQPLDSAEGQSRQIAEGLDEMAGHQQDLDNAFYGEERPAHPQRQAGDAELSQQTSGQQSEGVTPQREMQANGPAADEAQALVDHHGEWPILEDVHTLLRNRQGDAVIADAEVSLTNRDIESAIRDAGYTREEALQMLDEFQAKSPQHADLPALRRIVDCAEGNFNTSSSAVSSDLELQTALMDINQKYQEVIEVANQYRQYLAEEGQYMNVSDLDDLIDVNLASQADQTRQLKVDQCDPADLAHQLEVHAKELELLKKVMKDQMDGGSWESNGGAPRRNPNSGDGDGGLATMTDVEVETSAVRQMFEEIAPSITGRVDVEPRRAPQGSPSGDSAPARQEEVAPARPGSDELDAPILGREESRALVSDVEAEMHQAMDIDADGLVVPARNRMRTPHWDPTYVRVPLTQTQTQALAQAQTTTTTTYRDTPGGRKPPKRRGRDYDSNSDESRAPTGDSSYQYFLKKSTSEQWRIDGIERLEVEVARRRLKRRSDEEVQELAAFGLAGFFSEDGWEETA